MNSALATQCRSSRGADLEAQSTLLRARAREGYGGRLGTAEDTEDGGEHNQGGAESGKSSGDTQFGEEPVREIERQTAGGLQADGDGGDATEEDAGVAESEEAPGEAPGEGQGFIRGERGQGVVKRGFSHGEELVLGVWGHQ
jgi:hypothetical protein